jgi:hypothetical protein
MKKLLPFAASAAMLLPFASPAAGAARYGTRDQPLDGARYRTMLALAGHLDSTAHGALDGAVEESRRAKTSDSRFLSPIRTFARSTGDFRGLLERYQEAPFEVPPRVSALAEGARSLNARLRAATALRSTYDDWGAVIDVLGRMTVLLDGGDVEVPTASVTPALSGAALQQFRSLARDLDQSASGAHEQARRRLSEHRQRGPQFLGELGYFAARSRDLRAQVESGDVRPRKLGPAVESLLAEARQADRAMREADVFPGVWSHSGRTITILERMASLVRS